MNKKFNEKFSAFTLNVLGYLQDMLDYAINEPIPSIYQFSRSAYKRTALYRSEASEAQIRRKIYQLHKQGLIKFEHNKVNLTLEGKRLLNFSNKKLEPIRQPQSWDKIWRVVIWDIAEKQRGARPS